MIVAHVHTEVEKPPLQAADALRTAVRRFQTEDRSMPEEPGARAAAGERLRAAPDPCHSQLPHIAAGPPAAGGRHSARQGVAPATLAEFTAGTPTGRNG